MGRRGPLGRLDRIRFFLEYVGARFLFASFGRLPASLGRPLGRLLARGIGRIRGRHSRVGYENLARAFPTETPAALQARVGEVWAHLGEWFWEFARLARSSPTEILKSVDLRGLDRLKASQAGGKGVLLFTAHCGNWEFIPACLGLAGLPPAMIARRAKNPWVNDLLTAIRERFGARVFLHKNAARESLRWLKGGGVLGLLFDQRITNGDVPVPFFGRPARTTGLPAFLALRLACPVHPIRTWRENGRVFIEVEPALAIPPGGATTENVALLTAQMTAVIEGWIRDRPSQWLWIHNRWKP